MDKLPQIEEGDVVVIGDVHGQIHLLWEMVKAYQDTGARLIFMGDLIDRAAAPCDDLSVLTLVKSMNENPDQFGFASVESLKGNHEDMLLKALNGEAHDLSLWHQNGGAFGILHLLRAFEPWLKERPLYLFEDGILYVHAGVRPGVPLLEQRPEDLVWIRRPFIGAKQLKVPAVDLVIHGHTWNEDAEPILQGFSVGVDTGAFATGILTSYHVKSKSFFKVYDE